MPFSQAWCASRENSFRRRTCLNAGRGMILVEFMFSLGLSHERMMKSAR